jgi:hypothetical protein
LICPTPEENEKADIIDLMVKNNNAYTRHQECFHSFTHGWPGLGTSGQIQISVGPIKFKFDGGILTSERIAQFRHTRSDKISETYDQLNIVIFLRLFYLELQKFEYWDTSSL